MSKTEQKMPARDVVIFAYDGAQLIDIAGPTQALTTANEEGASPPYAVRIAAVSRGPIRTASGVKLIAEPLPRAVTIDTLLVPGGPGVHSFRKDRSALAALRRLSMRSRRVCAICTGAFALAQIGLLNNRRVVTHWRSCAQLAEEFPEVCVDPEPLFIQAGKIWTTAGVTAGIDLSLALIEQDHSAALATSVARRLVVYMKRPGGQRQYSEPLELQRAASAPTTVLCKRLQAGQPPLGASRHLQRVPAKRHVLFIASLSQPQVSLRPKRSRNCAASSLGPYCKPRD
jgi:transcriptional regulator GlxA family with amidase domain